jgi:hypothetical protein
MLRHPRLRWIFLLGTLPTGFFTLLMARATLGGLDLLQERYKLVYRFDPPGATIGAQALERVRTTLAGRLEGLNASRIHTSIEADHRVRVEFVIHFPQAHASADGKDTGDALNQRVRGAIEQVGDLRFFPLANPDDLERLGGNMEQEQTTLDRWRREHGGQGVEMFNATPRESGGPCPGLCWLPRRPAAAAPAKEIRFDPLLLPDPRWRFTQADLDTVGFASDSLGRPAIAFEMAKSRRQEFGDFTESLIGKQMAIVISGQILTAPIVKSRLPGSGIIEGGPGGFTLAEVRQIVSTLRSGALPCAPVLVSETRSQPSKDPRRMLVASVMTAGAFLATVVLFVMFLIGSRAPVREIELDWSDRSPPCSP